MSPTEPGASEQIIAVIAVIAEVILLIGFGALAALAFTL